MLREAGFEHVEVTSRIGDDGIDGKGIVRINRLMSFHIAFQYPTPPRRIASIRELRRKYLPNIVNYAEREHKNRKLGELGEAFVIEYERYRLNKSGRPDLAKEVEWSSDERGDGLGYDVRSFNPRQDEELFIEVKTTISGKDQPFFISENEVAFSKERADQFSLYRVYGFRKSPRIFRLEGEVNQHVRLQPQIYKASFS